MRALCALLLATSLAGCTCGGGTSLPDGGEGGGAGAGGGVGGGAGGGGAEQDGGVPVQGGELFGRLAGLWSGPASQTPLGNFPLMNVDFRAATAHDLFGRADLTSQDSRRFGWSVETYDGGDALTYRNGGYFQGVLRDNRTALMDTDGGSYHFCAVPQGCGYIDATFSFPSATSMVFDVKVLGQPHVYWTPTRVETRTLPVPFPADWTSQGAGTAPWPTMPSLNATVNWSSPLSAAADVWIVLTTTNCAPNFSCQSSRSIKGTASAGATSLPLTLEQLHSGSYQLQAIVDVNQNFATTRRPDSGDLLAVDVPLTVSETGATSFTASATYTVP